VVDWPAQASFHAFLDRSALSFNRVHGHLVDYPCKHAHDHNDHEDDLSEQAHDDQG
jgi:hypothetical protein